LADDDDVENDDGDVVDASKVEDPRLVVSTASACTANTVAALQMTS